MRLTLRTLLAYLDEILEPSQAEELSHKIRESDFASGLVHRIRNSMGRLRVSSPPVVGSGLANDANTVAQYLDNQLPSDRVSDFEKICLESDMHLAEVASCHQILTLVLGEPAHVPDPLRARIYGIPHHYASIPQAPPTAEPAAPPAGPVSVNVRTGGGNRTAWRTETEAEVGERNGQRIDRTRGRSPFWVAAVAVLLLLSAAVAYLLWDGVLPRRVAREDSPDQRVAPQTQFNPPKVDIVPEEVTPAVPADEVLPQTPAATAPPVVVDPMLVDPSADEPEESVYQQPMAESSGELSDSVYPDALPPAGNETTLDPTINPAPDPSASADPAAGSELVESDGGVMDDSVAAEPSAPPAATPESVDHDALPPLGPAADALQAPAAVDMGRFLLQEIAAFQLDDQWVRVGLREPLFVGMRIRVPVAFHPPILTLSNSVNVTLGGRSELEVLEPLPGGVPHIGMPFGRAIVSGSGGDGQRVAITVGDRTVHVAFDDPNAEFAFAVVPYFLPGDDPSVTPRPMRIQFWPSKGRIVISEEGQPELFVEERKRVTLIGDQESMITDTDNLPTWVDAHRLEGIDKRALLQLEQKLDLNRPLPLALAEIADSRLSPSDLKSLSMRGLASFDRFGALVDSLDDEKLHAFWGVHILELQAGVARGAESSRRVLEDLQSHYGPDGRAIHRMLVGYTPEQLEEHGAADLVEGLDHAELADRVVASTILLQITGKTHLYNPRDSIAKRRPYVTEWQERLRQNQIQYAGDPQRLLGLNP